MQNGLELEVTHHAVFFGYLTRATLHTLGEEGKEAVKDAVVLYGSQRGQRMALRAKAAEYPLDLATYRGFREWRLTDPASAHDTGKGMEQSPDGYTISRSYSCPWHAAWQEYGMEEEAPYYCRSIDRAILEGFNPSLGLEVTKLLTEGDNCCEMHWMGVSVAPEGEERIKAIVTTQNPVMEWGYHLAHLYASFIAVLSRFPHTREILAKAKEDFLSCFGETAFIGVDKWMHMNFAGLLS